MSDVVPVFLSVLNTLLSCGHTEYAELTFEPNSTTLYSGEHVNLTCHMREANVSEWYYEFKWNDKPLVPITSTNILRIPELTTDRNGDYQCIAHHNSSEENKRSNRATLSVSAHRPRATVRASRTSIPVGGSLTLTCSVEESEGWSYDWFTRSPDAEEIAIATNPVQNSLSISQGGSYWCRGRRTHSDFFSEKSHVHHIDRTLSNRSFIVLQHNWTQIFSGETISIRCEIQGGGDTQWEYKWRTTSSNQPVTGPNTASTHSEYRLGAASVFHSGEYWCKARADWYSSTEWSDAFQLRVTPDKPRPRLTADDTTITGKGRLALTCSVENASEWSYDWFRRTSASSAAQILRYNETDDRISISEEGIYSCRGRRGDTTFLTEDSNLVTIENRVSHKASVALQPDWSLVFSGEGITVRCEVPADVLTEWEYEWTKPNSTTVPTHNEYRIVNASSSDSGSYRCLAKDKKNLNSTTEWSDDLTLTVSERPSANLSADHRAFPVGGSVLLTCSVGPASPGWKYYWYRGEKTLEPLTDEDFKSNGQSASASREGLYWCRGGRGDPVYYTQYSNSVRIHGIGDFSGRTTTCRHCVSVMADSWSLMDSHLWRGSTSDCRMEVLLFSYELLPGSNGGTEQNSSVIQGLTESAGYACRAGRGDPVFYTEYSKTKWVWSEDSDRVILESPVHPVTGGQSVTLSCSWFGRTNLDSNFSFYKNDELLQSDVRGNLEISAVSKSDEGFYKCEHSGVFSPESWMSVKLAYIIIFPQLACVLFVNISNGYGAVMGCVVGLVLRVLSGLPSLGRPVVLHFPGSVLDDGVYVQYAPVKTISMLSAIAAIVLFSYLTSVLFNKGLLPEKCDEFKVKVQQSAQELTLVHGAKEDNGKEILDNTCPQTEASEPMIRSDW
ncbi:carcinoembryonic antigen-related cell adhesion molecule 5-like [Limanda limanda]|uniref:carcinoembryonic antigen-related cell adhesion molecule 5-like n=1 Tax=Limanda limanda TaxID=27771 RepID=UPI0029C7E491|nr:carcinoembryonic antigen-related cell adhesion molecule 5-like [Limanda limanda]